MTMTTHATLGPLRFVPFLRPMIWGGRGLSAQLGKILPTPELYGESWEVSDHALHYSVVADGPCAGTTLRDVCAHRRAELLGPAAHRTATFPWLIKFLDCRDWLSVQVHPDAEAVATLWPGEGSKTEAWHVLHVEPESRIYAGLKAGVGPSQLRRAIADGTVADCLHSFIPQAGDCVFLPAGTVHAVGGGVLMAEIQETSDATFRLFDWNRVDARGQARTLHVEEAFQAIHWDYGPVQPRRVADPLRLRNPLVHCDCFDLEHMRGSESLTLDAVGRLRAMIVLEGRGRWSTGQIVAAGQVWVLPASLPECRLTLDAPFAGLLATLP